MKNTMKKIYDLFAKDETIMALFFSLYVIALILTLKEHEEGILDGVIGFFTIIIIVLSLYYYYKKKIEYRIIEHQRFKDRFMNVFKEIVMYIPVLLIQDTIVRLASMEQATNQARIIQNLKLHPIITCIEIVVLAPIYEEMIFRYFPSKFIKNKIMYIATTSILFAALHVLNDERWYIYIFGYIINSLYCSYRFYKTKNVTTTVALHRLNNLISILIFM